MDTNDLEWFLDHQTEVSDDGPPPALPGDWGRRSVEASIAQRLGTVGALRSRGELRLHGDGVHGHSAELGQVGLIAAGWQRAISATGAALEQVQAFRGALPADIMQRTTLVLNATPAAGSIILRVEPQRPPLEDPQQGEGAQTDTPGRPLADRASEALIDLLARFGTDSPTIEDDLASSLRALGPRVGSTLANLATAINRSDITLDATWAEPGTSTIMASINPQIARRVQSFVAGRGLDSEEETFTATLRTVSDVERWLVELPDGRTVRMGAKELPAEEIGRWRIGDVVELRVRVSLREQPDGYVRRTSSILQVSPSEDG